MKMVVSVTVEIKLELPVLSESKTLQQGKDSIHTVIIKHWPGKRGVVTCNHEGIFKGNRGLGSCPCLKFIILPTFPGDLDQKHQQF